MSVSLICGSLRNLRIAVHKGRQYTNALADEIDKLDRFSVQGTAFGKGHASIYFSADRYIPWVNLAIYICVSMRKAVGDPSLEMELKDISAGKA